MDAMITPRSNELLRGLSANDYAHVSTHLAVVDVPARTVLHARDEPIAFAFFPMSGVASVVATYGDGNAMEIVAVGREGMLGIPAVLGAGQAPSDVVMEIAGSLGRIRVAPMLAWMAASQTAAGTVDRYVAVRLAQTGQSAACHRLHHLDARVARWLLDMHDRVSGEPFVPDPGQSCRDARRHPAEGLDRGRPVPRPGCDRLRARPSADRRPAGSRAPVVRVLLHDPGRVRAPPAAHSSGYLAP